MIAAVPVADDESRPRGDESRPRGDESRPRGQAWLGQLDWGWSTRKIARYAGYSVRTVQLEMKRARETPHRPSPPAPFDLTPIYPITPLTPDSSCPHRGPLRRGSPFYCEVCGQSGMDHHPALQRAPATDPKPDPKPWNRGKDARLSRRQRRRPADRAGRAA